MALDKINKIIGRGGKYNKLRKPLEAAEVCGVSRGLSQGRFEVISFKNGLLTVGVANSSEAANLQMESQKIIELINKKCGKKAILNIRFKIQ
jgi:predicted nucleic acid-binding Zn ribbon protein